MARAWKLHLPDLQFLVAPLVEPPVFVEDSILKAMTTNGGISLSLAIV